MANARKKVDHPWLSTAIFCDQTLMDTSGAYSAIRILDRWHVPKPAGWDGKSHLTIPIIAFISFKSGDVKGQRTVRLYHTSPKGKKKKMFEKEVNFLGGAVGVNLRIGIEFGFKTDGIHWIDVYVGRWHATRMPLTILFHEEEQVEQGATAPDKV